MWGIKYVQAQSTRQIMEGGPLRLTSVSWKKGVVSTEQMDGMRRGKIHAKLHGNKKTTAAVWYEMQKLISGPWLETEFKILDSGSGQVESLRETALLCSTMESWLEFPSSKSGRAVTGLIASLAASNPTVHRSSAAATGFSRRPLWLPVVACRCSCRKEKGVVKYPDQFPKIIALFLFRIDCIFLSSLLQYVIITWQSIPTFLDVLSFQCINLDPKPVGLPPMQIF